MVPKGDRHDRADVAELGDSHILEPPELWRERMPRGLGERMPRCPSESTPTARSIHIDGQSFERRMPAVVREASSPVSRSNSSNHAHRDRGTSTSRLVDLDPEGIWGEVVYPSLGLWNASFIHDEALNGGRSVSNDWSRREIILAHAVWSRPPRCSMLSVDDAVAELGALAELGLHAVCLPTLPDRAGPDYNRDDWEPLWAAAEEAGMVVAFHIGSDSDGPGQHAVPRARRRGPQLRRDHLRRAVRGDEARHRRRARPAPRPARCSSPRAARRGCRSSATA